MKTNSESPGLFQMVGGFHEFSFQFKPGTHPTATQRFIGSPSANGQNHKAKIRLERFSPLPASIRGHRWFMKFFPVHEVLPSDFQLKKLFAPIC